MVEGIHKKCSKCGLVKLASSDKFPRRGGGKLSSFCKTCHAKAGKADPVKRSKTVRASQVRDPRRYKGNVLRYKYGIDMDAYDRLFAAQDGRCAGCGELGAHLASDFPREHKLHVDHCHKTGTVRGLLCRACNMALGSLEDDPARLLGLAAYLSKQTL
jgi:hypothetical protein